MVHVFARAIRENFNTRFMRIALVAFLIVPSLYAGLYLWSNIDPYANMKNLPVALVCEDEGAMIGGVQKNLGEDIAFELIFSGELHFIVTDIIDAKRGVNSEDYYFAIVIPRDFSSSVASINNAILVSGQWVEPTPAKVSLLTNDANNFLAHQVADQAGESLQVNLKQQISNQLTLSLLGGLKDVHDNLVEASSGAQQIADALGVLNDSTDAYAEGIAKLSGAVDQLEEGVSRLSLGANQVADGNAQLDDYAGVVRDLESLAFSNWTYQILPELTLQIESIPLIDADLRAELLSTLSTLSGDIQTFHSQLASGLDKIDTLALGSRELSQGLSQLLSSLPELKSGVTQLQEGFASFENATQQIEQGASKLTEGLKSGYEKIPALSASEQALIAKVVADPLQIQTETKAQAAGYAAGLLPFFLALSAWIGAYTIFVLLKPFAKSTFRMRKNAISTTFGNYLVPLCIGIGQMLLLFGVVKLLKLPPVHTVWSLLFMILMTATYTMIIFALVSVLKKVGLFLGLVLLVLQLTAAGGTFPWQTTPEFFQVVHHIFPMGYAVDAFRQTFYGGNLSIAAKDAVFLGVWLVVFFTVACIYAQVKLKRERVK